MALAARLSRPVSVHCVKAHGKLVEILGDDGRVRNRDKRNTQSKGSESAREEGGYDEGGAAGATEDVGRRLPPRVALQYVTRI